MYVCNMHVCQYYALLLLVLCKQIAFLLYAGNITQKMATACAVTDQQNVSRKKLKKKKKFHVKGEH